MIRRRLMGAACAAACALGASMLSAQEARSYAWYAELVAVDQAAKTMTVKAQTREAVNRYIGNYEPGDKLMVTWVPVEGEADTIIYSPKYEVMKGIKDGYILPAEFVSADTDNNSLTFRTSVPDGVLASIAGVQAGQWIRVTAPMHQPEEIAVLTSAVAAEMPNLKPPPPPPMPEPAERGGGPAPAADRPVAGAGGAATGIWAVSATVSGNPVTSDCTFTQEVATLTGTCSGELGEGEVSGEVSGNEVTFRYTVQFNGQDLEFEYSGALDGDAMTGTVSVFGTMGEFTASRQ